MRIRSHLDLTLFVIFLHVDASRYDDEFRSLVRSLKAEKGTDIAAVFEALSIRERRTWRHELYHYWQGLRLPFLHVYALLSYREALIGIKMLAQKNRDWKTWHGLGLVAPSFQRLDVPLHLSYNDAGILHIGREPPPSLGIDVSFTPKDLLECAASIYDFQASCVQIQEMSDAQHFTRWRKLNPCYLNVFDICARFLGSQSLALRCCLPLINAAFHTSIPERAFAELLARMWGNFVRPAGWAKDFIDQKEPCRWPELFRIWLAKLPYDTTEEDARQSLAILESRYFHMGRSLLGSSFCGQLAHPFLGANALAWQRAVEAMPALEDYIDIPGYISGHQAHDFASKADPPFWIIRVFFEDGDSAVYPIGPGFDRGAMVQGVFADRSDSEMRGFILDSVSAYSAFRRAADAHFTQSSRTCHHVNCPHFEANYCNCYPLIPKRFEDCGFPTRIRDWITSVGGNGGRSS